MTQLERFIAKGEIEISRHPDSNLRRLLILEQGQNWFPVQKQAVLSFMVYYLNEAGEIIQKESVKPYPRKLVADTKTKVDAQMTVVPHPGQPPVPVIVDDVVTNQEEIDEYNAALAAYDNAVTEYEYFVGVANNPVNIFEVMLNITLLRAQQGKFDI